jgi:hypothetical protein
MNRGQIAFYVAVAFALVFSSIVIVDEQET